MADIRVTQQYVDVFGHLDAREIQAISQWVEVVGLNSARTLKVLSQYVEVVGLPTPPTLRVYQQNVDVAGQALGTTKLGQLYVEILQQATTLDYGISAAFALSDQAVAAFIYNRDSVDSLIITEDATGYDATITANAVDTFVLTEYATGYDATITVNAVDTLVLIESETNSTYRKLRPVVIAGGQFQLLQPGNALDLNSYQFPIYIGTPSQVMQVPANGTQLEWATPPVPDAPTVDDDYILRVASNGTVVTWEPIGPIEPIVILEVSTDTILSNPIQELLVLVNASSGHKEITLPPPLTQNYPINIKKIDSSDYTVIVLQNDTETIDGDDSSIISGQWNSGRYITNKIDWFLV